MSRTPVTQPRPVRRPVRAHGLALTALALIGAALLTFALTSVPGPGMVWPRWLAMMALAWWVPGALLVAHWRLPGLDGPTALVLALGLGLGWMMLLMLGIHWWPGEIAFWSLALSYAGPAAALALALIWHRPSRLQRTDRSTWGWLAALLLLAVVLRLPGLAYHEFHYDEVLVLTRAKEAIRGEDDAFARHTKGPGEIAIATVVYGALGMANEGSARLPLGVASVGSVLGLALLGRAFFGQRVPPDGEAGRDLIQADHAGHVGFWSGVLLLFNGFALGLSRIVQYQAAVLLLMPLAVLAAWMFARSGRPRWLALSALLSACGLVLHYEFGLMAPVLLWLTWLGWRRAADRRAVVNTLLGAGAAGSVIVAAAYLPALLNPFVATTQSYLGTRLGALGQTFNLAFFVEMGTFYNSIYFFVGLLGLTSTGLIICWRRRRTIALALILWFTPFLALYLFVVQFPGTHFYLLMPPWSIAAALPLALISGGLVRAWRVGPPRAVLWRGSALLLVGLWLLVSGWYLHLLFFRQQPEYLINFAEERIPFFWAPYGENVPAKPRFGFPIREGWKTLGVLSEWKYLNGSYASNERSRHLRWYAGDFDRVPFDARPDFIFVASHLQEPDPAFDPAQLVDYAQIGEVRVRGEPRIAIWAAEPSAPYLSFDAEQFAQPFDGVGPTFSEWPDPSPAITGVRLGDEITLLQGGVAPQRLAGGDTLHAYMVWRADRPPTTDYKLFVHIADASGRPVAQWDGLPGLGTARTGAWAVGERFDDHALVAIPASAPRGNYRVLVGLYHGESGARLGGEAVEIGTIRIR